ncbi:class I lanthipeptide [Chitinophaga solisilvae]|uniref:Uncharacterized protein n=1 Tax=Chitinophaga solisilvae TaxID=1233460 RepID=A0A3S1AZZ9_9BACT|nr:class I lanthipeptide [Chitinophaga solisilvae]NSL90928.1 hypothetical protein [Chitinophaga solisilvae]
MKKQKIDLSKKLFLNKETVASLNVTQQEEMIGGALPTTTLLTQKTSVCRESSPSPTKPCCALP